jgi:hypothetical protein
VFTLERWLVTTDRLDTELEAKWPVGRQIVVGSSANGNAQKVRAENIGRGVRHSTLEK